MRRHRHSELLVVVVALLAHAARAAHSGNEDTYYCDWWCAFGWLFFVLAALGIVACFFYGVTWYGGGYHVHRERFVQYDKKGRVISYGYRTAYDGDVDAAAAGPHGGDGVAASPYVGHAAHYGHSYAAATQPHSKRQAAPPLRR